MMVIENHWNIVTMEKWVKIQENIMESETGNKNLDIEKYSMM